MSYSSSLLRQFMMLESLYLVNIEYSRTLLYYIIFKDLYAHKIKLGTWERRLRRLHEPKTATERNYLFIVCAILVLDFFFLNYYFACLVSVYLRIHRLVSLGCFVLNFRRNGKIAG